MSNDNIAVVRDPDSVDLSGARTISEDEIFRSIGRVNEGLTCLTKRFDDFSNSLSDIFKKLDKLTESLNSETEKRIKGEETVYKFLNPDDGVITNQLVEFAGRIERLERVNAHKLDLLEEEEERTKYEWDTRECYELVSDLTTLALQEKDTYPGIIHIKVIYGGVPNVLITLEEGKETTRKLLEERYEDNDTFFLQKHALWEYHQLNTEGEEELEADAEEFPEKVDLTPCEDILWNVDAFKKTHQEYIITEKLVREGNGPWRVEITCPPEISERLDDFLQTCLEEEQLPFFYFK